jgi:hypothetical protein
MADRSAAPRRPAGRAAAPRHTRAAPAILQLCVLVLAVGRPWPLQLVHAATLSVPAAMSDFSWGDTLFGNGPATCAPWYSNLDVPNSRALGATTQLVYSSYHFTVRGLTGPISISGLAYRAGGGAAQATTSFSRARM